MSVGIWEEINYYNLLNRQATGSRKRTNTGLYLEVKVTEMVSQKVEKVKMMPQTSDIWDTSDTGTLCKYREGLGGWPTDCQWL